MLQRAPASLGLRAELAVNGRDAVNRVIAAHAERRPFDLVLMDMQMPVMGGLDAARAIRAAGIGPDALPIVALSANAYADDVDACLKAGMQGHLAKPLRTEQLLAALERHPAGGRGISPGLRAKYEARRAETLQLVARLVNDGDYAAEKLDRSLTALHQLAGTAAMFGETALGEAAKAMENDLRQTPPGLRATTGRAAYDRLAAAA